MDNQNDAKSMDAETNKMKEPEKKPDNTNFRKVTKDDESEMFVCNICNWEATEAKRVKQHISKKHRERSVDSDEEDEEAKKIKKDENSMLDESMLDKWDKSSIVTSTQVQNAEDILDLLDESGNPLISDDTREALEKTGDITMKECDMKMGEGGTELERELMAQQVAQTKEISNLEEKMKVKDDIILMNEAKINSLEMEGLQKQAKMDKFQRIVVNVTAENKKLKEEAKAGTSSEMKGKVKKLNEELKEKNKKIEESDKRVIELMKKFGDETNLRAKAEAEVIRANKMVDYLHEIIEKKKAPSGDVIAPADVSRTRNQAPRCLDQDRVGGCPYGDLCRFTHDEGREEIKIQKTEDCGFWMEGSCGFTDKACRHIHDPKKIGTRSRQEARRSHGGSFLGQSNPAAQISMSQAGAGAGGGLQLLTAGGQLYLHQGGQVIQQVQPVLGL